MDARDSKAVLAVFGILALSALAMAAPAPTLISFDDYTDGHYIDEEYAHLGVHFISDYRSVGTYRCAPKATASPLAVSSPPNILVNDSYDTEIFSSINVPMFIRFDQPG